MEGLAVDWTLRFFSAKRLPDEKLMEVWLQNDAKEGVTPVWTKLPLAGNERLPLMESTDVFRIRGIIQIAGFSVMYLRDAELEYVRSDKPK